MTRRALAPRARRRSVVIFAGWLAALARGLTGGVEERPILEVYGLNGGGNGRSKTNLARVSACVVCGPSRAERLKRKSVSQTRFELARHATQNAINAQLLPLSPRCSEPRAPHIAGGAAAGRRALRDVSRRHAGGRAQEGQLRTRPFFIIESLSNRGALCTFALTITFHSAARRNGSTSRRDTVSSRSRARRGMMCLFTVRRSRLSPCLFYSVIAR